MKSPVPSTMLTGTNSTFTWTAIPGAAFYSLSLGSTGVGSDDLYSSGNKTVTSVTVAGLRANGEKIYARLYTQLKATVSFVDYTYTALTPSVLTSPSPGSTLTGTSALLNWTAALGATQYVLWVGNTGVGSHNLYAEQMTGTSATVGGLPTDGEIVYARLYTDFNGDLQFRDYTFTEKGTSTGTVSALSCGSVSITGSATVACSVTLSSPALAALPVSLSSTNSAVKLPATITVPSKTSTVGFAAVVSSVGASQKATITANAGAVSKTLALQLNPVVPALSINETSLAFGSVEMSTRATQSVTLSSTGTTPLIINAITITGQGFSATSAALPLTLNPGQTLTVNVGFNPLSAGSATANLSIESNSSAQATTAITLSGIGTARPSTNLVQSKSADSFVDSVGLNVHFSYYGSVYTNLSAQMIQNIQQLGVRHLRDQMAWQGTIVSSSPFYAIHNKLGTSGVKTDYILTSINYPMSQVRAYPTLVNDMEAVEASNEFDASGDSNWVKEITSQQDALCAEMPAGNGTENLTVLSPSLAQPQFATQLGNLSSVSNGGNSHAYFGGYNPGNSGTGGANNPAYFMKWAQVNNPGEPIWATETGFWSKPGAYYGGYGVSEAIQAVYTPRALLEFWNAGVARTYIYELADDESDAFFGLIRSDGTLKPAFGTVSNLLSLLKDPGQEFTPDELAYGLSGGNSSIHQALFQKRDGSFYLALWVEALSYNFQTSQPIAVPSQNISLNLNRTVLSAAIYQFGDAGKMTTTTLTPGQTLPLTVTDRVEIVKLILQ